MTHGLQQVDLERRTQNGKLVAGIGKLGIDWISYYINVPDAGSERSMRKAAGRAGIPIAKRPQHRQNDPFRPMDLIVFSWNRANSPISCA